MKYLAIVLTMLLATPMTLAKGKFQVPTDAVIKVFDAKGKQIGEMSRADYKVVKIVKSQKVLKQRLAFKEYREKHHSFIIHAGPGKDGLRYKNEGIGYTVKEKDKFVFGATYCFTRKGKGICGTGLTNKTYLLGVKIDF